MAAIQIKGTARSVFPGRLCTLCGLWCMADSAPHTLCGLWCMADSAPHTPRLALRGGGTRSVSHVTGGLISHPRW